MYDVAFIGTGADPDDPDFSGFAMAYHHARAYRRLDDCRLAACADIVPENAEAFAEEFDVDDERVYEDHEELLTDAEPDVVSVCVPPAVHADVVIDAARAGSVEAIHCEKPMAKTWGDSRLMAQEADRHDVQLTFNHQRRFAPAWKRAKELLDDGEIGDLRRIELSAPNIYDWGTHSLDLCGFFNDERPAEWVLGGIDYREENVWFGAHNENQALSLWEYDNGVFGLASTGHGSDAVGCLHRLLGTEGTIEVKVDDGPDLRIRRAGDAEWEEIECPDSEFGEEIDAAIEDVIASLREGRTPELAADRALNSTEIIFATYESARRRGRVDLPLEIDDNPLDAMVESGALTPRADEE